MPFQYSPQQLVQAAPYHQQQQQGYQFQQGYQQPGFRQQPQPYDPQQFYSAPYYVQQTQPTPPQPQPTRSHLTETKYVLSRQGPLGSAGQATAAQNFFARSKAVSQLQTADRPMAPLGYDDLAVSQQSRLHAQLHRLDDEESVEDERFVTNFRSIVSRFPPPLPALLQKRLDEDQQLSSNGKIRVVLRVTNLGPTADRDIFGTSSFQLDKKKCQVNLFDPSAVKSGNNTEQISHEERQVGVAAPKMFAFDGTFTTEDPQAEVAACSLTDIITSVVNGNDGCLFCYGHANLGKSKSMLGSDECAEDLGLIPIAITWLYKSIKERRAKSGAKFSVRVSAMEVTSQRENIRDLLLPYASDPNDQSPGAFLRQGSLASGASGSSTVSRHLQNQSELRASSAEKAAYYLDAALSGRSADVRGRESHLVFTLHVYQYSAGAGGAVNGGRSRLHLIDFGGCERTRLPGTNGITLSGLGNVILGIFNSQKHLPHRESKVTQILKECLSSVTCQATMLAHVSPDSCNYSETLHTVQLAARLHKLRRKRLKSSSSEERRRLRGKRSGQSGSGRSSSELTSGTSTNYSSSELSCDTVVYRSGPGMSDGSGTDGEHPPTAFFRSSRSLVNSREGSHRGSLDEIPRPASAGGRRRKILTNGAISPRQCLSPAPRSPRSLPGLPAIPEVVQGGKMPLSGLVPIQSSHQHRMRQLAHMNNMRGNNRSREVWIDGSPEVKPQALHKYGYMDEHKASMINSWVEHQSVPPSLPPAAEVATTSQEPVFRALTQFKTIDSDESSEVNNVNTSNSFEESNTSSNKSSSSSGEGKRPPPTPPRRLTPPREEVSIGLSKLEKDGDQNSNLAQPMPSEPSRKTDVQAQPAMQFQPHAKGNLPKEQSVEEPAVNEPEEEHPLRILSEENLTVVSSFRGSVNNLEDVNDHDQIDPSKLSFFRIPDFGQISNPACNDMINQRFREFEELHEKGNSREEMFQDPRFPNIAIKSSVNNNNVPREKVLSTFSNSSFNKEQVMPIPDTSMYSNPYGSYTAAKPLYQNLNNHSSMLQSDPYMPPDLPDPNNFNLNDVERKLTPQKQFQLLSQSLRHPDGSSNPELNMIPAAKEEPQRQQGNGCSDLEDDIKPFEEATSPNNNSNPILDNSNQIKSLEQPEANKPTKMGFGQRFLKIFSSTRKSSKKGDSKRSKSCDDRVYDKNRSASNSPAVNLRVEMRARKGGHSEEQLENRKSGLLRSFRNNNRKTSVHSIEPTPSTLSLDTSASEWEFQGQKEENMEEDDEAAAEELLDSFNSVGHSFSHLMNFNQNANTSGKKDRKSSGYDSHESSSLDSNQSGQQQRMNTKHPWPQPVLFNTNVPPFHPKSNTSAGNCSSRGVKTDDISPSNNGNSIKLMQYDESDILRMDKRTKGSSSSTNNSSPFSSLS